MRARRASIAVSVLVLAVGSAEGCQGERGSASLSIHNASDASLGIEPVDELWFTMEPTSRRGLSLNGGPGDCTEWQVRALTEDGVLVATTGPPVCDGDEWVITQEDVDAAVLTE